MNVRGFKSKRISINRIVRKVKRSIVALNETQVLGRSKMELEPFTCWSRNRTHKGGGGVSTAVAPHLAHSAVAAGQGEGEDEWLVTRVEAFSPALCVINCYGEQRGVNKEVMEEKWRRLRKVMEEVRTRGEHCALVGDPNRLVSCDEWGVEGNQSWGVPGGQDVEGAPDDEGVGAGELPEGGGADAEAGEEAGQHGGVGGEAAIGGDDGEVGVEGVVAVLPQGPGQVRPLVHDTL